MKIDIYFRGEKKGSVESRGEILIVEGREVRTIVEHYQRTTEKKGLDLINHMLEHMRSMWWAEPSGATLAIAEKEEEGILPDSGPSEDRLS
jgi:hypothetical protein